VRASVEFRSVVGDVFEYLLMAALVAAAGRVGEGGASAHEEEL
jgi:hypothetical protein